MQLTKMSPPRRSGGGPGGRGAGEAAGVWGGVWGWGKGRVRVRFGQPAHLRRDVRRVGGRRADGDLDELGREGPAAARHAASDGALLAVLDEQLPPARV